MRLLFVSPSIRPLGARRSLVELLRHLPPCVTPLVVGPAEEGIALEIKDLGIDFRVVPQGAWRKVSGRFTALTSQIPKLWKIRQNFQPDLLHCNEYHPIPQTLRASGGKVPLSAHVRLGISPEHIRNYQLSSCRRIVVVSQAVKDLFPPPFHPRVRVVYNGVEVGRMTRAGEVAQDLKPFVGGGGSDAGESAQLPLVVGLLGLVSERKNQLVAAEAVAMARARGADVRLVLAGDAFRGSVEYGEKLRARLRQPDLGECAQWIPFQKAPATIYRALDVNLLISGEEGFGRTIIEAGAMGIPSIGARTGGIPELIRDGETGWLVEAGDAEGLARLLGELAQQREEIRRRGELAQQRVEQHFTIAAHVRQMMEVWEEAIEEFGQP